MSEVELKPCPFCGGDGKMRYGCGDFHVECADCGASSAWVGTPRDIETMRAGAAAAWNMRANGIEVGSDVLEKV